MGRSTTGKTSAAGVKLSGSMPDDLYHKSDVPDELRRRPRVVHPGPVSITQRASQVMSRIGARYTENLAARTKFMEGVLPKTKQSRYMIPIDG